MLRDFSEFYFEFEDNVASGKYTEEQANEIFRESYFKYLMEQTNIEIPKEDAEGFCFYVKLLNTDNFPRKKFKFLAKKVTSVTNAHLSYTGQEDPVRYWVGPFETQPEALKVSKQLNFAGVKNKVEKWTPKMIQNALLKEEKEARNKVNAAGGNKVATVPPANVAQ